MLVRIYGTLIFLGSVSNWFISIGSYGLSMPETTYDAAEAAPAQLASALLEAALSRNESTPTPASSGLDEIDTVALHGGFRYGEITSIAGASGTGKTLVRLSFSSLQRSHEWFPLYLK